MTPQERSYIIHDFFCECDGMPREGGCPFVRKVSAQIRARGGEMTFIDRQLALLSDLQRERAEYGPRWEVYYDRKIAELREAMWKPNEK